MAKGALNVANGLGSALKYGTYAVRLGALGVVATAGDVLAIGLLLTQVTGRVLWTGELEKATGTSDPFVGSKRILEEAGRTHISPDVILRMVDPVDRGHLDSSQPFIRPDIYVPTDEEFKRRRFP